ncbi:MAG: ABC transporter ATP-binding protein, partial [Clostridia bacterium]|nr:ABC transporter ATP-binding protein [Clostridia bacterium]
MIKKLAKSIREFKKASILSPLFVTLEVALECILPWYMVVMLESIQSNNSINNIVTHGLILLVLAGLSLLFGILSGVFAATAAAGFARNLRKDMYYRVQGFAFSNIDKFSAPSLVTRMTTDVANVQMSYMMIIRVAVRAPIMLVFSFIMAFTINTKVAWIFLITVPVLAIALLCIFRFVDPIFNKVFKKYDAMNESVQENIKGIRVVKSYVRDEYENKKFAATAHNVRKDFLKGEKLIALSGPVMQFCMWFSILMICFLGAKIGAQEGNENTANEISSLIVYATQILSSLMMLSMIMVMISISKSSAKRIVEV